MIVDVASGLPIEDIGARLRGEARSKSGRPWVMSNFVTSIDGVVEVGGGSTPLSDDDDRTLFHAIRGLADTILVGAGTVRAENYRPARGLVIVSGSLNLDREARVFSDPERRPTILTLEDAAEDRGLAGVAEIIRYPELDGHTIIGHLGASGIVLCEGGPRLHGTLAGAGLVDEINWTVSPILVGGDASRMVNSQEFDPLLDYTLDRIWRGDRSLFLRYVR